MEVKNKKLSILIDKMIPNHIIDDYPEYTNFIKSYFTWVERDLGEYDMISNMLGYSDIDNTHSITAFVQEYRNQYLTPFPGNWIADVSFLVKNIRSFYKAKGSQEAFKFLFRALYDKELEFYYPRVDILRCSDGRWFIPKYIITDQQDVISLDLYSGKLFTTESGAKGSFDEHTRKADPLNPGQQIIWYKVSVTQGSIVQGEIISVVGLPDLVIDQYVQQPGYYTSDDGFLSSSKKIQDSFYYQDFSYELQTNETVFVFSDLIQKAVHPAGMKRFNKFVALNGTEINIRKIQHITTWLIEWRNTLDRTNTSVQEMMNIITYVFSEVTNYWTYQKIQNQKFEFGVAGRWSSISDFKTVKISDFITFAPDKFPLRPSTQITIV